LARDVYIDPTLTHSIAHQRELEHALGTLTQWNLARQISDLLLIDALISNWDRFEDHPQAFGRNCHVVAGQLVAIDQGAAFTDRPYRRPMMLLEGVERFNTVTVDALRRLTPETTRDLLFPKGSSETRRRFAHFWTQRQKILARIDALEQTHGRDAIYFPSEESP